MWSCTVMRLRKFQGEVLCGDDFSVCIDICGVNKEMGYVVRGVRGPSHWTIKS